MELQFDTFEEKFKTCVKAVLPKIDRIETRTKSGFVSFDFWKRCVHKSPYQIWKVRIYHLAPLIVEEMARLDGDARSAIVLVISPLVSLIKDQVRHLSRKE